MSEVISFRLDPNNPREAGTLQILARCQEQGYSVRQVLTEALLKYDQAGMEQVLQLQMDEILTRLNEVRDQLEHIHVSGVQRTHQSEETQAVLSNAFVLSVKSAAKPGITLET
jgi:hypothetical protein